MPTPPKRPPRRRQRKRKDPRPASHDLSGVVQPALVIGIGQLGVDTLTHLRERLVLELGSPRAMPHVRLVAIDTDPETIQQATTGNPRTALRTQETLLARLQRPSYYLKAQSKLAIDAWLNTKLLHRIPREQTNAGMRPLGRLAFVDNYRMIAKRIEAELHRLSSHDTQHESDSYCDLGLRPSCRHASISPPR